jgi:branched-chain amino acid transport system ATP-binding protein
MLTISNMNVYYGYIHVIKGISIGIARGEVASVIGLNGSGKSTLLNAIIGLVPIRDGKVLLEGFDITNRSTEEIVIKGLALVPERREIFTNLSVLDNLWMGAYQRYKHEPKKSIEKDIDFMFGLFPRLNERPHQIGKTLSGGEQQMLAISRALMSKPKMLLLDEPSLGLAPLIVQEIFRILKELQEGGTSLLLIEQTYKDALSIADKVYILQTGKIVWEGMTKNISEEALKKIVLGKKGG